MLRPLVIAAAILAGTPALAQEMTTTQEVVRYNDLDLTHDAGRQALARRIRRAVYKVCGISAGSAAVAEDSDAPRCKRESLAAATARMDQAIAAAQSSVRFASR